MNPTSEPSSAPRQAFVEYQDHGGNWIRCSAAGQGSRLDEQVLPRQLQSGHQGSMAIALRRSPSHSRALHVPDNEHSLTVLESAQQDAASTDITGDISLIGRHDSAGLWQRHPNTASRFNPWGSLRTCRTANTGLPFMEAHLGMPDTGTPTHRPVRSHPQHYGQRSPGTIVTTSASMPQSFQINLGAAVTMHPLAQAIVARTSSLIPYNSLSCSIVSGDTELGIDISMLVRALVYSFSDRLENFQGTNHESVFGLLRTSKVLLKGLRDFLPSVQSSTGRCFADNLFEHAVEICDVQATAMVLDMAQRILGYSIDPNTTRCVLSGKPGHYTPLEVASAQQDIELVRLLLGIGADPNHSYWTKRDHIQGALECALWDITRPNQRTMDSDSSNKFPPASIKLVRLLLDNHVRVRPETIRLVTRYPFTKKNSWTRSSGGSKP
ncbi:hypothetical protein PG993_005828 [Apiospora rasikravindrae]|uniref:Ankyrin n=1 Tax=Apiospora rasikravindrae TaxID=990691 RepID=A0ABR1TCI4_9PEZI